MKTKGIQLIKGFDMYGQQISFWYKGSLVYSTIVGIIVSIVIAIVMIMYSVLLIIDVLNADKPSIIEVTEAKYIPPKYSWTADYPSIFDKNSTFPPFNVFSDQSSLFQMSIGLEDIRTHEVKPYDPAYLSLQVLRSSKGDPDYPLFYDYCKRFLTESNQTLDYYKLNRSLCIYSDFVTEDSFTGDIFKALNVTMNVCKNDTWYYEPLQMNIEYNLLKRRYESIILNKVVNNSEYSEIPDYDSNSRITKLKTNKTVVCKTKEEITKYVKNTRVVIYFINSMYNVTDKESPIRYYLDKKKFSLSTYVTQSVSLFFKNDVFKSFTGLIPYSLVSYPPTYYYMNYDKDITKYGDFDYNNSPYLLRIYVQSSKIISEVKRVYPNIFNIMGTLGGLAKILMIIFTVFVTGWANYKLKEELINNLYAVVDPHKEELVNLKFTDYMIQRKDNKHIPNKLLERVISDDVLDTIWKEPDLEKREALEKKYEIIYETYKYQAYSGISYTLKELFLCTFCKCWIKKTLRDKNKTYEKALKKLESDTDFLSIIRALQEFDNIKKFFFDQAQQNIFDSFKHEEIIYDEIKNKEKGDKKHKCDDHDLKDLEKQSHMLSKVMDWFTENKAVDLDKKLLLNLLDYQEEIVDSFLKSVEGRKPSSSDENKINKKTNKPLTDGELQNIINAFKKN